MITVNLSNLISFQHHSLLRFLLNSKTKTCPKILLIFKFILICNCFQTIYSEFSIYSTDTNNGDVTRKVNPVIEKLHYNFNQNYSFDNIQGDMFKINGMNQLNFEPYLKSNSSNRKIIIPSCQAFIQVFAKVAAQFTECSIKNSRPLTFCLNCVAEFIKMKDTYGFLSSNFIFDKGGKHCWDTIVNSDRVQILVQTKSYMENLWNGCFCHNCFNFSKKSNESTFYNYTEDTVEFLRLEKNVESCFLNYTKKINNTYVYSNVSVCNMCKTYYNRLNTFYSHLEEKYNYQLCLDIVDKMNSTRKVYSGQYGCGHQSQNALVVLLLSGVLSILPIIFYAGSKIHSVRIQQHILKQKRLDERTTATTSNTEHS